MHQLAGHDASGEVGVIGELAAQSHRENTMIALIEQHRSEVAALCSRFGVQSLEVFGSAADGTFDPAHSDIDFLVEFLQENEGSLFDRYFELQEALEQLFARKIDLVTPSALKNPYLIATVNKSRQTVYASAREADGATEYDELVVRAVEVTNFDFKSGHEVRARLADLNLKDTDIADAVGWARKSE